MLQRLTQPFSLATLLLLITACGERPVRIDGNSGGGSGAGSRAGEVLFAGTVTLEGALAEATTGSLFISARPVGSRMPILSRRFRMSDPAFHSGHEGGVQHEGKVLHYELTREHFMGGMETALPADVELKISYDPDGIVETFEGVESVVIPATLGAPSAPAVLHPGMAALAEPPSAFTASQPTEQPTSQPTAPAQNPNE